MSIQDIIRRLKSLEQFRDRLTLRSYVAKSADLGSRYNHTDVRTSDHELAAAARGEDVLAKAAGSLRSDDDILNAAAKNPAITPVEMGVISSHVSRGDYSAARKMVVDAGERQTLAKAVDPVSQTMGAVDQPQTDTDDAELREAFVRLEAAVSALTQRLDRLEARRPAPTQQRTVAKAQQQPTRRRRSKADLLQMLAYIDSPQQVGALSSVIQSGDVHQIREAEKVLVSAQRAHEAQRVRAERKGWQS